MDALGRRNAGLVRGPMDAPVDFLGVLLAEHEEHLAGRGHVERADPPGAGRHGERELHDEHGLARAALGREQADLAEREDPVVLMPGVAQQPSRAGRGRRVPLLRDDGDAALPRGRGGVLLRRLCHRVEVLGRAHRPLPWRMPSPMVRRNSASRPAGAWGSSVT